MDSHVNPFFAMLKIVNYHSSKGLEYLAPQYDLPDLRGKHSPQGAQSMDKDRRHYHENAKERKHEKEKGSDLLVENCLIFPAWRDFNPGSRIEIWVML